MKFLNLSLLFIATFLMLVPSQAMNYCRSYNYKPSDSRSLCNGKRLPKNAVRLKENHRLECSANVDNHIRRPQTQSYDLFKEWTSNESYGDLRAQDDMQEMLIKAFPDVKWEGRVNYSVVEKWQWEECVYGEDLVCGTYECNCTTDSKGNRSCMTCTHSCWHDVTRYESVHCSNETMTYEAEYTRPDYNVWKAGAPGYYNVIPNKYDLLPGEVEVIQTFSNSSMGRTLSPAVKIGDAWNEYSISKKIDGGAPAVACKQNANHHLTVKIDTIKRKIGKKTPNAFRLPIEIDGQRLNVMEYESATNSDGKTVSEAKPSMIRLMDVGGVLIDTMARQSRTFEAAREELKQEAGELSNMSSDEAAKLEEDSGFWENTHVRVRLRKVNFFRDRWVSEDLVTAEVDTKSLQDRLDGYKVRDDLRFTDLYELDLSGELSKNDIYHMSTSLPVNLYGPRSYELVPGSKYVYEVAMFREGVPFYLQPGGTNPDAAFYCGLVDCEANDVFSKALPIEFTAPKGVDKRGVYQRINDFLGDKEL